MIEKGPAEAVMEGTIGTFVKPIRAMLGKPGCVEISTLPILIYPFTNELKENKVTDHMNEF